MFMRVLLNEEMMRKSWENITQHGVNIVGVGKAQELGKTSLCTTLCDSYTPG